MAARDGARVVVARLPFPAASEDDVVERILAAATDRTRLAIISHVTSPTALVFPIERIVRALDDRGIDTLVDGAHAPGMVPLDLDALGAAYYAANLHKWVCAPKGAAFLHVRRDRQAGVRPATISHGANAPETRKARFRSEFDWQGTLDPTAWLAVPAALDDDRRDGRGRLAGGHGQEPRAGDRGRRGRSRASTGTTTPPESMVGSMVALPLPGDGPLGGAAAEDQSSPLEADPLQTAIYDRFAIEVPIGPWPVPAAESPDPPRRVIRVSIALHNDRDDVDRLVARRSETIAADGLATQPAIARTRRPSRLRRRRIRRHRTRRRRRPSRPAACRSSRATPSSRRCRARRSSRTARRRPPRRESPLAPAGAGAAAAREPDREVRRRAGRDALRDVVDAPLEDALDLLLEPQRGAPDDGLVGRLAASRRFAFSTTSSIDRDCAIVFSSVRR